jgi:hypothetical protein
MFTNMLVDYCWPDGNCHMASEIREERACTDAEDVGNTRSSRQAALGMKTENERRT